MTMYRFSLCFPLLAALALAAGCAGTIHGGTAVKAQQAVGQAHYQTMDKMAEACGKAMAANNQGATVGCMMLFGQLRPYRVDMPQDKVDPGEIIRAATLGALGWKRAEERGKTDRAWAAGAGHNTTITGTASGTQSGVVVPTGAGSSGSQAPADSHDPVTQTGTEE